RGRRLRRFGDWDGASEAPVTANLRLVDGPARLPRRREGGSEARIVATDPIRVAENLMALGVLPVAVGTYTEEPSRVEWPWPASVEDAVRDRIGSVGLCGSDPELVELADPDLIVDLYWSHARTQTPLAAVMSRGRYDQGDFA